MKNLEKMCTVAKGAEARRRSRLDFRRLTGPVFEEEQRGRKQYRLPGCFHNSPPHNRY